MDKQKKSYEIHCMFQIYIYICYKYFNEAAHLLSAEFMQTGSVWGFLPWYRFKQTISFSGSGLFFDIFALLALIFSKILKIYQVYTLLVGTFTTQTQ